jgi:uncharacterized membrane protein YraQ (UPF0718 family)/regulator of protease activity HflC (stomatin/prohibitin superfamily)
MNPLWDAVRDIWYVFHEASLYVVFGFVVAALIQASVSARRVSGTLGRSRWRSILLASLIGIPLPLCSCSVLPTTLALKKKGARRGASIAFLVSTPETGVDSIVLTYGLMDTIMAIFRPISAMLTATIAGFLTDRFGGREEEGTQPGTSQQVLPAAAEQLPWKVRFSKNFSTIFNELSHWIFVGLVVSGLITWLVPPNALGRFFGSGLLPMLAMLVIGLPMYICASGSTPLAAALIYKGLSPGAALVFLLVGPATNIGTMGVVAQNFGKRTLVIYLLTLVVLSLVLGSVLNWVYATLALDPVTTMGAASDMVPQWIRTLAAAVLVVLFARSLGKASPPRELTKVGDYVRRLTGVKVTARQAYGGFLVLVLIGYLSTGVLMVRSGEVGMVRRFGALVRTDLAPGFHVDLPAPFTRMTRSPVESIQAVTLGFESVSKEDDLGYVRYYRERPLEDPTRELFCGDWNLLDITASVLYRIKDPEQFHFKTQDPAQILHQTARAIMTEVFSRRNVDRVFTVERRQIETVLRERLSTELRRYDIGVEILDFSLLDVHAPAEVHPSFRAVAGAAEERLAIILSASAEAVLTRSDAEIVGVQVVNGASAKAASRIGDASGFSGAFEARAKAFEENPVGLRRHMGLEVAGEVLPLMVKRVVPVPAERVRAGVWFYPREMTRSPLPAEPAGEGEKQFPFWDMGGGQ